MTAGSAPARGDPSVSVVVTVHDGEQFITKTVESVLTQSFEDLELVVVDDGSADATPEILAGYAADDRRVRIHRQPRAGVCAARNRGIEVCRAPLIAFLDGDDVATRDRLGAQLRFLDENGDVALVGGQYELIDAQGRTFAKAQPPRGDAEIREVLRSGNPFLHSAVTVRKRVVQETGGYRRQFVAAQDLDLWLRVAERTRLANLPQTVVSYRIHDTQTSVAKIEMQATMAVAARLSARRREEGLGDPIDHTETIDEEKLISQGVAREQIDSEVVQAATWIAKTASRAGYEETSRELLSIARRRARASSRPGPLLATVWRAQAKRLREQGRPLWALRYGLAARIAQPLPFRHTK
jgi:GT2 family glycosyltransferase